MDYPFIVLVGEKEIAPTLLNISNETFAYLYFTYNHSQQSVTIVSSGFLHLYNELIKQYSQLQADFQRLNQTYQDLLKSYIDFLGNYSRLQNQLQALNSSYQEQLASYTESAQNLRNLTYIFAAGTAILLIVTVYLSKRASTARTIRTNVIE
jgi:predicted PurR-regulated permease PerM